MCATDATKQRDNRLNSILLVMSYKSLSGLLCRRVGCVFLGVGGINKITACTLRMRILFSAVGAAETA